METTRNLPQKIRLSSLSLALKQNDNLTALKKLSGLTIKKILLVREQWNDLQFEYEQAQREIFFLTEETPSEKNTWKDVQLTPTEKAKIIESLNARVEQLEKRISETIYLPMLIDLRRENEEELLDTLKLMVADVVRFHKTTDKIDASQATETAFMIMDTFKGLTIEDVALCFYSAKSGKFGEVYNRIDGPVIMNWLHAYQDKLRAVGMEQELKRHIQSKGTTYKEGADYRILEIKGKPPEYDPSKSNLKPVRKLTDLL
jgi:predicted GIY-YIG superfamily endonuclease